MARTLPADPILARFRSALDGLYGERLKRVVLFGSRARAVFLDKLPNRWAELDRLADLRVSFLDDTGAYFDARPYPAIAYRDTTPLMHEIRREGVDL